MTKLRPVPVPRCSITSICSSGPPNGYRHLQTLSSAATGARPDTGLLPVPVEISGEGLAQIGCLEGATFGVCSPAKGVHEGVSKVQNGVFSCHLRACVGCWGRLL
jgi:hypothetical protein